MQQPGAKREMGEHRFQRGAGTTGPPAGDDPEENVSK